MGIKFDREAPGESAKPDREAPGESVKPDREAPGESVKFDRKAPGEGVECRVRLETGKAYLRWQFHLTGQPGREQLRLVLRDSARNVVLEGRGLAAEEEPLQGMLLQPCLWEGITNPCQYIMEAGLYLGEIRLDYHRSLLPLRELTLRGERGVYLNGNPYELRTVEWNGVPGQRLPEQGCVEAPGQKLPEQDCVEMPVQKLSEQSCEEKLLKQLVRMGANCILVRQGEETKLLRQLCDELGVLVVTDVSFLQAGKGPEGVQELPMLQGGSHPLFDGEGRPAAEYYRHRAKWSREPFVYLEPGSVVRQRDGNFCVTAYSSCHRLALYSDGVLFSFQSGQEKFVFGDIPARGPCLMLTAEGEGCSCSLAIHKVFTKSSPIGDNSSVEYPL